MLLKNKTPIKHKDNHDANKNKIEHKNQELDGMQKFTVTHTYPDMTEEEREEVKRDILFKMYKKLSSENKSIDTKVKS
ncbi:MAG: hypothetical protein GX269_01745 [Clostridiales bacterium]|nr:hypothetical protein [Clostridiales bacterium]